jgi:hypothetical protein
MPVGMLQGGAVKVKPRNEHWPVFVVLFLPSVLEAGELFDLAPKASFYSEVA